MASRAYKVVLLSSGQALTSLVGVVSAIVLTRVFSKGDYGTYRQTMLAYTFAVPFVVLGLDRALFYFLPGEKERPRGVLVENLLLLAGAGSLLSLFIVLGGNHLLARRFHNPDLASLLLLLAPYPLLMLPAMGLSGCLMARDRTEQVAGFNVASRLFMFLAVVLPCLLWPEPKTAILGTILGALAATVVSLHLMFRACPAGEWRPTAAGLRQQLAFSVPLGVASLVGTVNQSLDQVLVSAFCDPEAFAVYSVGATEVPLVGIVTAAITSVVIVDYAVFYQEGRLNDIVDLIHRAMVKAGLILIPAMLFLLCVAPELMRVLFGRPYESAAAPFRVYLLLLPLRTITFGAVLQATGRSRDVLLGAIVGLAANAALAWPAIKLFGPVGAAMASVGGLAFFCVPYLGLAIRRQLRCSLGRLFPWRSLAAIVGASALGALGVILLRQFSGEWPDLLVLALAGTAYAAVTLPLFVAAGWVVPGVVMRRIRSELRGKIRLDTPSP